MEKMRRQINMQILIVTMLIITISSVVSSAIMYKLLMDTKNGVSSNSNVAVNDNGEEITENITDDSFATYQENYKNNFNQLIEGYNEISIFLGGERTNELPGVVRVYLDSNNDAYFEFDKDSQLYSKYGETYKVESEVANIFVCSSGNGGYSDAIFLKLDGTASSVDGYDLEQNLEVKCEDVQGVTMAVNVISYTASDDGMTGASEYAFVDVNGNIIK